MSDDLKPCKFCGGAPELFGEALLTAVHCTKDYRDGGCSLRISAVGNDAYSQVVTAWNHRIEATRNRHEGWTERGHAWLDAGCPSIVAWLRGPAFTSRHPEDAAFARHVADAIERGGHKS